MRTMLATLALLVGVAAPVAPASADAGSSLFSRPAVPPGPTPTAAVLADVTEDGVADLVTSVGVNEVSWGISITPGRAGGGFDPHVENVTEQPVHDFEVVDADGDGHLDVLALLALDDQSGIPTLLPGSGDPVLGARQQLGLPIADAMAAGRLASEARPWLVLETTPGLVAYRPSPIGGFVKARDLAPAGTTMLLAEDLDGDGLDELVAGNFGGQLTLYRDLAPVATASVPGLSGLEADDVTGDGLPEVLALTGSNEVRALGPSLGVVDTLPAPAGANGVGVGDVDGDDVPDFVAAGNGPTLTVAFGDGGSRTVPISRPATEVFVRDATGDGHADLLALETDSSIVEVIEGDGAGGFAPQRGTVATQANGWHLRTADFNNDGKLDALAGQLNLLLDGYTASSTATTLLGSGTGGFSRGGNVSTQGSSTGLDVGDVNGDGNVDVVVSDYHSGTVSQYLGGGDGTFQQRIPVPGTCELNDGLVAGDFNGDAYADVAGVCRATVFRQHLSIFLGSPAGLLPGSQLLLSNNAQAYVLRTGDVNGDGNQDIAIGSFDIYPLRADCLPPECFLPPRAGRGVGIFLGQGNGLFEPLPVDHVIEETFVDIQLADVNGDQRDDLVVPLTFDDLVEVSLGRADGTLSPPSTIPSLEYPLGISVADLTGDGEPDLVMDHGPMMISVTPGLGGGEFGPPTGYAARGATGEPRVGDFSGDGRPDVLVPQGALAEVFVQGA